MTTFSKKSSETLFISAPVNSTLVSILIRAHRRSDEPICRSNLKKDPKLSAPELRFSFSCFTLIIKTILSFGNASFESDLLAKTRTRR